MTSVSFSVDGLPPKKDGANSMWGNRRESGRLVRLRKAALAAMDGRLPLKSGISLSLKVCVGAKNGKSVGDLDTFVTGVCDGLMKAAAGCRPCSDIWYAPENNDIRPGVKIAIEDDGQVTGIQAAKVTDAAGRRYYEVALEGD